MAGLSRPLHLPRSFVTPYRVSYNPKRQASWFGLIPFRSPLLRETSKYPEERTSIETLLVAASERGPAEV